MALPIMLSQSRELSSMQTTWASQINPVLDNAITQGILLQNVDLVIGTNSIDHHLGHKVRGWIITRKRGPANIYDTDATNPLALLKLNLVSDAIVSVDLYVF